MSPRVEGFLVALAGGALLFSAVIELIEPSTKQAHVLLVAAAILVGASRVHRTGLRRGRALGQFRWRRPARCDHPRRCAGEPRARRGVDRGRTTRRRGTGRIRSSCRTCQRRQGGAKEMSGGGSSNPRCSGSGRRRPPCSRCRRSPGTCSSSRRPCRARADPEFRSGSGDRVAGDRGVPQGVQRGSPLRGDRHGESGRCWPCCSTRCDRARVGTGQITARTRARAGPSHRSPKMRPRSRRCPRATSPSP